MTETKPKAADTSEILSELKGILEDAIRIINCEKLEAKAAN